jgi:hypothetical protein
MCSGNSALHAAATNGDALAVRALIKAGADVQQCNGYEDGWASNETTVMMMMMLVMVIVLGLALYRLWYCW